MGSLPIAVRFHVGGKLNKSAFVVRVPNLFLTFTQVSSVLDVFLKTFVQTIKGFLTSVVEVHSKRSEGLGDTIAKFTKATGIKAAVDAVSKLTKKPCGCKNRQKRLNQLVPYKIPR